MYVSALYLWSALPLVPYMTPAVPVLYLLAVVLRRQRPAVLVLRRFGVSHQDLLLVHDVAPSIAAFARVWWLGDRSGVHVLTRVKRFTATAGVSLFGMVGGVSSILLSNGWQTLVAFGATSCAAVLTWMLLESMASGKYGRPAIITAAIGIILASDKFRFSDLMVPPPARGTPALITAIVLGALWLRHRGDTARVNLAILEREAEARFVLFPRYLLNAPVLASELYPLESEWRAVVERLARRSSAIVLDVSFLDDCADGLRWEISLCHALGMPCLYLCHSSRAERVRASLLAMTRSDMPAFLTYGQEGLPLPTVHGFMRRAIVNRPAGYRRR
jgi:hypothetical protein